MDKIMFEGNSLKLIGRVLNRGGKGHDFTVVSDDMTEKKLSDFGDKIKVITSFPSLDTPVCDLQLKTFNKKATRLSDEIIVLGISKDLPFAQKRFCEDNDIKNVVTLSDYRYSSFGINYGLLIKQLNLLARAVVILDKNDIIRYVQIVEELTKQPDYDDVLSNLEKIEKNPSSEIIGEELPDKCTPCEKGGDSLSKETVDKLIAKYNGWSIIENKKLFKQFKFKDFKETKYFVDLISIIAEEQGHHPDMKLIYNKLDVYLTTHVVSGLTENDFIMVKIINELNK